MTDQGGSLHILVEGQTEETIVRDIIGPYLSALGWWVNYSIVKTKRPASGPTHRGGVTSWTQIDRELRLLLRNSHLTWLTTMLDYYAFPGDAPGMAQRPNGSPAERVTHVEDAIHRHFNDERLIPHLTLHETETWVFAAREQLADLYGDPALAGKLQADIDAVGGVELVNDNPKTAPSKRLEQYCPGYAKRIDGPLAIDALGLDLLRSQCPHLDAWMAKFEG